MGLLNVAKQVGKQILSAQLARIHTDEVIKQQTGFDPSVFDASFNKIANDKVQAMIAKANRNGEDELTGCECALVKLSMLANCSTPAWRAQQTLGAARVLYRNEAAWMRRSIIAYAIEQTLGRIISDDPDDPDISMMQEYEDVFCAVEQAGEDFRVRFSISAAGRYEVSGVDSVLLTPPPDPRHKEAFARGRDTRSNTKTGSAEDYGWRLFALWMRSLYRRLVSPEASMVFRETSSVLYKARLIYLMSDDCRGNYIPQARSRFDDDAYMEFQRIKNLLILGELGEGRTAEELIGAYLGYVDAYLKEPGLSALQPEALLSDERLANPEILTAAYRRTLNLDPKTSPLIEAARANGAESYAVILKALKVAQLASAA